MVEARDAELAFANAIDGFASSHEDSLSVSIGGPVLTPFIDTLKELRSHKDILKSQVEHMLIDRLAKFKDTDLHNLKEVRKRFDKASQQYDQMRERFLSMKKDTRAEVMGEAEDDFQTARMHYEKARFALVAALSSIDSRKKYEFIESIASTMDAHLRFYKQVRLSTPGGSLMCRVCMHRVWPVHSHFFPPPPNPVPSPPLPPHPVRHGMGGRATRAPLLVTTTRTLHSSSSSPALHHQPPTSTYHPHAPFQVLTYAQQAREHGNQEQAVLGERMGEYQRDKEMELARGDESAQAAERIGGGGGGGGPYQALLGAGGSNSRVR
ncbi:unnamed protein product [Closterium sp. Naga37s-1]|nr:unnamed protein product [Closterium sp. Naga37s-1]